MMVADFLLAVGAGVHFLVPLPEVYITTDWWWLLLPQNEVGLISGIFLFSIVKHRQLPIRSFCENVLMKWLTKNFWYKIDIYSFILCYISLSVLPVLLMCTSCCTDFCIASWTGTCGVNPLNTTGLAHRHVPRFVSSRLIMTPAASMNSMRARARPLRRTSVL